jgi:pimeloyl-ACP methyl ester carboxylesterase
MATYVLVHGGYVGGWIWREVATLLRAGGHEVFTPTLTGIGERVHLGTPDLGLDTHVLDIVNVLVYEDLHEAILVGHSYGGAVVSGVAERVPERLAHVVHVDAFVLEDGQSVFDVLGDDIRATFENSARALGDGWRLPHTAPRYTSSPLKPLTQPLTVGNPAAAALPRTYIWCTDKSGNPVAARLAATAARVRHQPGWRYCELPTGHAPMRSMPQELVALLCEAAA